MTTHAFQADPSALPVAYERGSAADRASRFWRSVYRLHFYAGVFVMPLLVMLAITGLIILYTDPITGWLDGGMTRVAPAEQSVGLQRQREAAEKAYPWLAVTEIVTPVDAERATVFVMGAGEDEESIREVFVNPHTGEVTGSKLQGNDLVGLANRLHGTLNNDEIKVPLPSFQGIFLGGEDKFEKFELGDVLIEIFACWGLALAFSGIYLWWPRKRQTGKALFIPRFNKRGRAKWRDFHAVPGIVLSTILVLFILTGLPWSAWWGASFVALSEKVTPNTEAEQTESTLAKTGDLDRNGRTIPWAVQQNPIPASGGDEHHDEGGAAAPAPAPGSVLPAQISLDVVDQVSKDAGMQPGYHIAMPVNEAAEDGAGTTYGSFTMTNHWPGRVGQEQTLYLDQFSGKTLSDMPSTAYGAMNYAISFGIDAHMGTQFGLINRLVLTLVCLLVLWSVFSAGVMWWKRRPSGSVGFPRRPEDVRLQRGMIVIALILAFIYPLWGVSVLAILALDRFVIRKVGVLRRLFGQRQVQAPPTSAA